MEFLRELLGVYLMLLMLSIPVDFMLDLKFKLTKILLSIGAIVILVVVISAIGIIAIPFMIGLFVIYLVLQAKKDTL